VITQRARQLRELTDWAGPAAVLVEHHPHRPGIDPAAWVEADAATNVALAALPLTMTCLYPTDSSRRRCRRRSGGTTRSDQRGRHAAENPDVRSPGDVLTMYPVLPPPGWARRTGSSPSRRGS